MRHSLTGLIALAVAGSAPIQAQTTPAPAPEKKDAAGSILDKAVNKPGTDWAVYGANQTIKALTDGDVPGGQVIRATVTAKGTNAWDVGASSPIQKPIMAGDTILLAVYLRGPELKDGETMPLPFIGINGAAPPYENLTGTDVRITKAWKLYYASGKAAKNYPGNAMRATIHLAGDKHVVDLGPVFVLDFGQNYTKKLPDNNTPQ